MFSIFLVLLYIGLLVLMTVLPPVLWAMTRLRLIYPITFFVICLICDAHKNWAVTKVLRYEIPKGSDWAVVDYLLILVVAVSAMSLLKELIQMVYEDFTWIGLFLGILSGLFFLIRLPSELKNRKETKERKEKMVKLKVDANISYANARKKVYDKFPDMEREYFYLKSVCNTESELSDFEHDWYLYIMETSERIESGDESLYTFDMWYDKEQMWRRRTYYKDFLLRDHQKRKQM